MSVKFKRVIRWLFVALECMMYALLWTMLFTLFGSILILAGPWTLLLTLYSWSKQEKFTFHQIFCYHAMSTNYMGAPDGYYPWFYFLPELPTDKWAQIHETL